jgi:2-polyprenyl-3-methyl-5-hydroxy-6-metoxy-1,4-benzoquinol methylase
MTETRPAISDYINLGEGIPYAECQRHINDYIFASKFVQNKVVLDVACGSGTGTTYLAGRGAKTVDRNYEVIPVKDSVFKGPTTILAVAAERG